MTNRLINNFSTRWPLGFAQIVTLATSIDNTSQQIMCATTVTATKCLPRKTETNKVVGRNSQMRITELLCFYLYLFKFIFSMGVNTMPFFLSDAECYSVCHKTLLLYMHATKSIKCQTIILHLHFL